VTVQDRATSDQPGNTPIAAGEQVVSAGLFQTLGVPLLAGREFGAQDRPGSPLVAIVSERLARQLWSHGEAIGRVVEIEGRSHEVVGVVGDVRGNDGVARGGGRERDPHAALYLSSMQFPQRAVSLVVRTNAQAEAILPAIRAVFRHVDPTLPVPGVRRLDEWIAESDAQPRLTATLAGVFAVVALFLTVVGIYGVIAYSVTQRTQEIGVRMAIGAGRRSVVGLVLGTAMTWAGGGILLGLLGAWSTAQAIASLLFSTSATDPFTFALAAFALTLVAVSACVVPAIRATRIDPVIALRGD
jgi:predicted permease